MNDNGVNLAGVGEQNLATAFTFGTAGIVFATLPFLFIIIRGLIKANQGHNQHSSSIISCFTMAFFVHFISCLAFMMCIKMMDVLNSLQAGDNYLQEKIFGIFWSRGKDTTLGLAGASSGNMEAESAYLTLNAVQTAFDFCLLLVPFLLVISATAYALIEVKKDTNNQADALQTIIWILVCNLIAIFTWFLWAKIASIALFMPNGDLISMLIKGYESLLTSGLENSGGGGLR